LFLIPHALPLFFAQYIFNKNNVGISPAAVNHWPGTKYGAFTNCNNSRKTKPVKTFRQIELTLYDIVTHPDPLKGRRTIFADCIELVFIMS
jgi:hypothetical protein